jgi:hypothetical protein
MVELMLVGSATALAAGSLPHAGMEVDLIDCLQMSAATFAAELRRHGFRISETQVVDISGICPGFAITTILRRGQIDRAASIAPAVAARQAELVEPGRGYGKRGRRYEHVFRYAVAALFAGSAGIAYGRAHPSPDQVAAQKAAAQHMDDLTYQNLVLNYSVSEMPDTSRRGSA